MRAHTVKGKPWYRVRRDKVQNVQPQRVGTAKT